MRFAGRGKGKSGDCRVITFFTGTDVPVFLLNIFAKNEKTDLKPKERRALKTVLADIVKAYRSGRDRILPFLCGALYSQGHWGEREIPNFCIL